MSELQQVLPVEPRSVSVKGEAFTVRPLGARQWEKALPHVAMVQALIEGMETGAIDPVQALFQGGESVFELLGLIIKKPVDWFDDADPLEVADLFLGCVEVNLDFFEKRLRQEMPQRKEQLMKLVERIGQKLSD